MTNKVKYTLLADWPCSSHSCVGAFKTDLNGKCPNCGGIAITITKVEEGK